MNTKATVLTNIIILLAGAALCYVHAMDNIPHAIVFITGITLIVPGLINLVLLFSHRDDSKHRPTASMKIAGWITSIAAVGLGVLMVTAPGLFTPVLVYIFGGVMGLASLMLIYLMSRAMKAEQMASWPIVGPVLTLIAGVVMICMGQPRLTDQMVTLMTGVGMIVFAVSWLMASTMVAAHNRRARKAASKAAAAGSGDGGSGQGGDTLAAAGKAESLGGGSLDRDAVKGDAQV